MKCASYLEHVSAPLSETDVFDGRGSNKVFSEQAKIWNPALPQFLFWREAIMQSSLSYFSPRLCHRTGARPDPSAPDIERRGSLSRLSSILSTNKGMLIVLVLFWSIALAPTQHHAGRSINNSGLVALGRVPISSSPLLVCSVHPGHRPFPGLQ